MTITFRSIARSSFIAIASVTMNACVSVSLQRSVDYDAKPLPTKGYVVANATYDGRKYGLGIVNLETKSEYVLRFVSSDSRKELSMIEVPEGTYMVTRYLQYSSFLGFTGQRRGANEYLQEPLEFKVASGSVVFVGTHSAISSMYKTIYGTTVYSQTIDRGSVSLDDAREVFEYEYPKFSAVPFLCVGCRFANRL